MNTPDSTKAGLKSITKIRWMDYFEAKRFHDEDRR